MPETTTEQVVDQSAADNSSTANPTNQSADSQATTENNVTQQGNTEQPASNESNTNVTDDDAALASFAKGQGINDLSELSDRERSLLKMARDNKSAFDKTKQNQPKLEETSTQLATLGDEATDVQKLAAKVANMEYKDKKSRFMQGKDETLEPVMAQIVSEKRAEYGDDYARALLNDLPTLYSLASAQKPADTSAAVEQARREERSSMNQSLTASAGGANATTSKPATPVKVTSEWIRNEYNPNDPEHRALVDAAMKKQ